MTVKPYVITLGVAGIFVLLAGVLTFLLMNRDKEPEMEIIEIGQEENKAKIWVDVGGAVEKPGLYSLPGDSRQADALTAAGGLGEKADREWVEKNLNLAQKLVDGAKIYIPERGETDSNKDSPRSSLQGESLQGRININTAGSAELDTLYGVGPATAEKIIQNRPYGAVEELLSKKAVKSNVYESIKNQITVF
ncbi:MAG: helix-hairpin-helix domain-containing protein [Patescibacteria group bacterium]